MNHYLKLLTISSAIALPSVALGSSAAYERAMEKGKEDSTNPEYQDWYLGTMRPAFGEVFPRVLGACIHLGTQEELTSLEFVFVVLQDGSVDDFYASSDGALAECFKARFSETSFPEAPKERFYFGLELSPGTDRV